MHEFATTQPTRAGQVICADLYLRKDDTRFLAGWFLALLGFFWNNSRSCLSDSIQELRRSIVRNSLTWTFASTSLMSRNSPVSFW